MKSFIQFLTEGKHWPADYIKTAYNMVKQSELGKQSWYTDEFINTDLKNIANEFEPLTHKNSNLGYFSPIIKMFIKYAGADKAKYQEFIERKLDVIIQRLKVITNDQSLETPAFKESFKSKWSFEDFKKETDSIFNKLASDQDEKAKNAKHEDKGYEIIRIDSYEELNKQFGGKWTGYDGVSEWCHTNGESTYETWTNNGKYNFFVIAKGGWKEIKPPDPETLKNPYDKYGLSLMAILVEVATSKLLNCTLRWNHIISPDKPGTSVDKAFLGWGDLAEVTGMDVKAEVEKKLVSKKKDIEDKLENFKKSVKEKLKDLEENGATEFAANSFTNEEKKYITELKSKTIKKIGKEAFYGCKSLVSIDLPAATDIGIYAFEDCTSLTSINLPMAKNVEFEAFAGCTSLVKINLPVATHLEDLAFVDCKSLTNISLPAAINIKNAVFTNCESLVSVNLPAATSISNSLFHSCKSLTSIDLPAVTDIGNSAFSGCISLTSINFLTAEKISDRAFYGCTSLTSINLPAAEKIDDKAFSGCTSLTSIRLPTAKDLGADVFDGCKSLASIDLPAATVVGTGIFSECRALKKIILTSAMHIGRGAFLNCASLASLNLPAAEVIGESVCNGCRLLKNLYLSDKIKQIDIWAFNNCENLIIHFPKDFNNTNILKRDYKFIFDESAKIAFDNN